MKKILFILFVVLCYSCNKDCDEQRKSLEDNYNKALQNSKGSPSAIDEITKQYNEKKSKLDC